MNRIKIILKEDRTLHEMLLGIVAVNIILAVVAMFVPNRQQALYAVLIGTVTAAVYVIHMAVTMDDAMNLDEKSAVVQVRKQMAVRYLIVCVVVGTSLYFRIADPIFLVISVITIKAGAYLQPTIHKILKREER
ncbi:MAG: nuclear envelope integral membrane protein [Lachnospiraceae bacterium]|nr:nuclear envelope integral membrane protein [Lachnospiraceae bacterium]